MVLLPPHVYIESQAGKWELGSDKTAANKMRIHPFTNACVGASSSLDPWGRPDPSKIGIPYIVSFSTFSDAKTRDADQSEYARKITYYTPELGGFQLGISYIPDTTNAGYATPGANERHDAAKTQDISGYKTDLKNVFAGGLTYYKKACDVAIKIALTGEMGKVTSKQRTKEEMDKVDAEFAPIADPKFKKLRAWAVGAQLDYKDMSFTAAYGNYMKSLTSAAVDKLGRNTTLYGFGARYNHPSEVSVSATYFGSDCKGNKLDAVTLGAEYKVASGIMPYAAMTFYQTKGKRLSVNGVEPVIHNKNKGTTGIVGIKLEF